MIRSLVAGLLAAAAGMAPGAAWAQDGSVRDMMRARMQARVEAQGRAERPEAERGADRGNWQRPEATPRGEWRRDDRGSGAGAVPRPDRSGERAVAPAPTRDWDRDARDPSRRPDQGQGWSRRDRGDAPGRPRREERRLEDQRDEGRGAGAQAPIDDRRDRDAARRGWGDRGVARRDARAGRDWWASSAWVGRRDDDARYGRERGWGATSSRGWDRGWRQQRRYDWSGYRSSNRGAYRLPRYYAPYGWNGGYRRFGIGARLSPVLFVQRYWIDDPFSYRLPEPYGPYRWVRYYNDAVLVDVETGEIVDAIHDIFW